MNVQRIGSVVTFAMGILIGASMRPVHAGGPADLRRDIPTVFGAPVSVSSPVDGQGLVYSAAAGAWVSGAVGGSISTTGDGLTGDGSSGTPLAVATDLERFVDDFAMSVAGNMLSTHEGSASGVVYGLGNNAGTGIYSDDAATQVSLAINGSRAFKLGTSGFSFPSDATNDVRLEKAASLIAGFRSGDDDENIGVMGGWAIMSEVSPTDVLATFTTGGYTAANTISAFVTNGALPVRHMAFSGTAGNGNIISMERWRADVANPAAVSANDLLGAIRARMGRGGITQDGPGASVEFFCDGGVGLDDFPGRIGFFTTADGASTLTERWRIDNAGALTGRSAGSTIGWATGLGAIAHLTFPSDQNGVIASGGSTRTIEFRSNSTEIASVQSTSYVADSYAGRVVVLSDASISFDDGAVQTLAISGDTTFTTTTSGLAASQARCCRVYVTTDGTQRNLTFPSAWKWLGSKPASLALSSTAMLSLESRGPNESDIVACWTVLGTGS